MRYLIAIPSLLILAACAGETAPAAKSVFACKGGRSVEVHADGGTAMLHGKTGDYLLARAASATGVKYVKPGKLPLSFTSNGDKSSLTVGGKSYACK